MFRYSIIPVIAILILSSGCVRKKIYTAELDARTQCEARESVLVKEVLARREDNALLAEKIGVLNRQMGEQDAELARLQKELTNRTVQMGESSNKLAQQKAQVEADLANCEQGLAAARQTIQSVAKAQNDRTNTLRSIQSKLIEIYPATSGATVALQNEEVILTLPDAKLFLSPGIAPNEAGKQYLKPLADFLSMRPEINVLIEAHTDNKLPKSKTIEDSWDWSQQRATNILRILVTEYNVNANQLTPVGKGEFYPTTSNETAEGRQTNRRTTFVLKTKLAAIPGVK
jgi:chemotaxis protein MotB